MNLEHKNMEVINMYPRMFSPVVIALMHKVWYAELLLPKFKTHLIQYCKRVSGVKTGYNPILIPLNMVHSETINFWPPSLTVYVWL